MYDLFIFFRLIYINFFPTFISGCMFPSNHWGEWNDSQLLPTIQRLMKGYNRYLRPNFNGTPYFEVFLHLSLKAATFVFCEEVSKMSQNTEKDFSCHVQY